MKKYQIVSIIIGALILIGLVSSFSYWVKYLKPEETERLRQLEAEQRALTLLKEPKEKLISSCEEFPPVPGEISCQEAIIIAQEQYPGEIQYINQKRISFLVGISREAAQTKEQEAWLIGINLQEPIKTKIEESKSAEVAVSKSDGEILTTRLMSGEIQK